MKKLTIFITLLASFNLFARYTDYECVEIEFDEECAELFDTSCVEDSPSKLNLRVGGPGQSSIQFFDGDGTPAFKKPLEAKTSSKEKGVLVTPADSVPMQVYIKNEPLADNNDFSIYLAETRAPDLEYGDYETTGYYYCVAR